MMNALRILLFYLLATSLYFLSQHTNSSQSVFARPASKLSMSTPVQENEYHKVADEPTEYLEAKEDSKTQENKGNRNSSHDLVYHLDYHGVTTHPIPKHPKPQTAP